MRKVRTEDAVGMTLCHDITAIREGFKGAAFRRGHVISEEDVPKLLDIGKQHIYIWEPEAGEIHEEDAALRLAALSPLENGTYAGPSEGKMVLTAQEDGLFRVNTELLRKLNSIQDVTISAMPDHYPVKKGARLASLRIVPLVTQESNILEAERINAESDEPLFRLIPYRKGLRVGVIITGSEVYFGRIRDRFEPVIREKLQPFGCNIVSCIYSDDDLEMLSAAIRAQLDRGVQLLILTGGMSVDPDDLTPTAIRNTGAVVAAQGVPTQPGNMTMIAYLGEVAILGVPGAAIHRKTTMLDVALPQIFTGVPFTKEELAGLGNGGLCQSCADCHWPNCTFGRY